MTTTAATQSDTEVFIIPNVKLTWPGRTIPPAVLAGLEGAKVNVDQTDGRRSYRDRIGVVQRVRMAGSDLRADLVLNPSHEQASQVMWDAENAPGTMALRVVSKHGGVYVDLVAAADGDTGLFESIDTSPGHRPTAAPRGGRTNMGMIREFMKARENGVSVDAFVAAWKEPSPQPAGAAPLRESRDRPVPAVESVGQFVARHRARPSGAAVEMSRSRLREDSTGAIGGNVLRTEAPPVPGADLSEEDDRDRVAWIRSHRGTRPATVCP